MSQTKSVVQLLRADVVHSVNLYFAPVKAVVREFTRSVTGDPAGKNALGEEAVKENAAQLSLRS